MHFKNMFKFLLPLSLILGSETSAFSIKNLPNVQEKATEMVNSDNNDMSISIITKKILINSDPVPRIVAFSAGFQIATEMAKSRYNDMSLLTKKVLRNSDDAGRKVVAFSAGFLKATEMANSKNNDLTLSKLTKEVLSLNEIIRNEPNDGPRIMSLLAEYLILLSKNLDNDQEKNTLVQQQNKNEKDEEKLKEKLKCNNFKKP